MHEKLRTRSGMRRSRIILAAIGALAAVTAGLIFWQLRSQPSATLPRATCGQVVTHALGARTQVSADPAALACFTRAARLCAAASIGVTEMGVDAGTTHVFTVEPGGSPCRVSELSQDYSANFGGSAGPVIAASCQRRSVTSDGVMLDCAGQVLLIPATISPPP